MLAGIRLSIGRGLIGMIVAEFFIGLVGLGYLIIQYGNVFRIDRMFVPVIVVAALGFAAGVLPASVANAQQWPDRPIRMLVPAPAGSSLH